MSHTSRRMSLDAHYTGASGRHGVSDIVQHDTASSGVRMCFEHPDTSELRTKLVSSNRRCKSSRLPAGGPTLARTASTIAGDRTLLPSPPWCAAGFSARTRVVCLARSCFSPSKVLSASQSLAGRKGGIFAMICQAIPHRYVDELAAGFDDYSDDDDVEVYVWNPQLATYVLLPEATWPIPTSPMAPIVLSNTLHPLLSFPSLSTPLSASPEIAPPSPALRPTSRLADQPINDPTLDFLPIIVEENSDRCSVRSLNTFPETLVSRFRSSSRGVVG
ncbi:hypothetical protein NM688_g2724 [Phlebia brevispora]|uniref:Uncharacterized protein n=1 Tax=Phlebia brevispora TaxID=194682 RepID=A0ACC1T811_9APHY|nr:hypothetical protein NM688_g2724 [Phlebia brevispora]